jgi:hypothetical protein
MLIVNDEQLCLAGIVSLSELCTYCSKMLAAYPLIMSDDVDQTVYHVTCALELASGLLQMCLSSYVRLHPIPCCLFSQHLQLLYCSQEHVRERSNLCIGQRKSARLKLPSSIKPSSGEPG